MYPNVSLSSGTLCGEMGFPVTMRTAPTLEGATTISMSTDKWDVTGATTRNFRPDPDETQMTFSYYNTDNSSTNLAVGYFGYKFSGGSYIFSAEL